MSTLAPSPKLLQNIVSVNESVVRARAAQSKWSTVPLRERVKLLQRLRARLAGEAQTIAASVAEIRSHSSIAEILVSEVMPLLDACKFAEAVAPRLLRDQHPRCSAPFWLRGVHLTIHREPVGVVLVIAPSNYPLFLPCVQIIQALMAGNAVVVKPAPGCAAPLEVMRALAVQVGLDPDLLVLMPEDIYSVHRAIEAGVDKIFLTGSAATGRSILQLAADSLTPVVCELSGCDAVVVLQDAEFELAAKSIAFALHLNEARTCVRPHRLIVHTEVADPLRSSLRKQLEQQTWTLDEQSAARLRVLLQQAESDGANVVAGEFLSKNEVTAFLVEGCPTTSELWQADIFAPVLAVRSFSETAEAIRLLNSCRYGLGASVFGSESSATQLISKLNVGFVTVNDIIVPTADPRLPFSGRKQSGFGVTRGAEGLLEFTQIKAVSVRRGARPHLLPPNVNDEDLFTGALVAVHGGKWRQRLQGAIRVFGAARQRALQRKQHIS